MGEGLGQKRYNEVIFQFPPFFFSGFGERDSIEGGAEHRENEKYS